MNCVAMNGCLGSVSLQLSASALGFGSSGIFADCNGFSAVSLARRCSIETAWVDSRCLIDGGAYAELVVLLLCEGELCDGGGSWVRMIFDVVL